MGRPTASQLAGPSGGGPTRDALTIERLAELSAMSPRNIRAHQARGLLSPPVVRGRVGYYDTHHLARLH